MEHQRDWLGWVDVCRPEISTTWCFYYKRLRLVSSGTEHAKMPGGSKRYGVSIQGDVLIVFHDGGFRLLNVLAWGGLNTIF